MFGTGVETGEIDTPPVMNMNFGWFLASDDAAVELATANLINRSVALAKSMKLDDPFIYMNYASLNEDVYAGYGAKNEARLAAAKKKYDPMNVFGQYWKGYFKLCVRRGRVFFAWRTTTETGQTPNQRSQNPRLASRGRFHLSSGLCSVPCSHYHFQ